MGFGDVLRVLGDGQQVRPHGGAFLGNDVNDLVTTASLFGAVSGLQHIAGITEGSTDLAVGQIGNELGAVEVGDVGTHLHHLLEGFFVVFALGGMRRHAQVVDRLRQHFVARVEQGDATGGEFLGVLRVEQQRPGIQRSVIAEHGTGLGGVQADAIGAPQVRHRVFVAGVARGQVFHDGRVEIDQIRQLGLVQLQVGAGTHLLGQVMVGRHHHVIAALAGSQLAIEGFIGIENVIHHLDAGLLLELGDGVRRNVVGPVVDLDHTVGGLGNRHTNGSGDQAGQQGRTTHNVSSSRDLGTWRANPPGGVASLLSDRT